MKVVQEIQSYKAAAERIDKLLESQNRESTDIYSKIVAAVSEKQEKLKVLLAQEAELDKCQKRKTVTLVKVSGTAYAGVDVKIDRIGYRLQGDVERVAFKKRDKKIVLVRYY